MSRGYDLSKAHDVRRMQRDFEKLGRDITKSLNQGLKEGGELPIRGNIANNCGNVSFGGDAIKDCIKPVTRPKGSMFWGSVCASLLAAIIFALLMFVL